MGRRGCAGHTAQRWCPCVLHTPVCLSVQRVTPASASPGPSSARPPLPPPRPPASLYGWRGVLAWPVLRVFLLTPPGAWPRPVHGPVVSAALPEIARRLAGGHVCSLEKVKGCGRPVPVAASPRPQCWCGSCSAAEGTPAWPPPASQLGGVGLVPGLRKITLSEPLPWHLPVSVSQPSGFTGHHPTGRGPGPCRAASQLHHVQPQTPVSKQPHPRCRGFGLETSLGEQAQPQRED